MSEARSNAPVLLGKITATHGIRGQLKVSVYSGNFETILALDSLTLKGQDGSMKILDLSSASVKGKRLVIAFSGIEDINQALPLVGHEIYVSREQLPDLDEGEFYWFDLIGLKVVTDRGESLGDLTEIIDTGSNDVYVARNGEREYLIPALEDVVVEINLDERIMRVSPPEGLLDL